MKGALIYGRSPYIPLRSASLVRSPRGRALPLHPGGGLCPLHSRHIRPLKGATPSTGARIFQGRIRGFAPAPHPQLICEADPRQSPSSALARIRLYETAAMLKGLRPRRRWLPANRALVFAPLRSAQNNRPPDGLRPFGFPAGVSPLDPDQVSLGWS